MTCSVAVLLYGDFPQLAQRVLDSIQASPGCEWISDYRLGLHAVSEATWDIVRRWTRQMVSAGFPVGWYCPDTNILKYPTMQRMLRDPYMSIADCVAWLDDDTYCRRSWNDIVEDGIHHLEQGWLAGQYRWYSVVPGYDRFLQDCFGWTNSPFCSDDQPKIRFCIGGWWMARRELFLEYGYPPDILRHKGGDWLLSALCHVHRLPVVMFDEGVVVNADLTGKPNIRWRRGLSVSEPQLGTQHFPGRAYHVEHQQFSTQVRWWIQDSDSCEEYVLRRDDFR